MGLRRVFAPDAAGMSAWEPPAPAEEEASGRASDDHGKHEHAALPPLDRFSSPPSRLMASPRDPEELGASSEPASADISPRTTIGAVHLTVSDLERSSAFYRGAVGLDVLGQVDGRAALGAGGQELVALVEEPGAGPAVGFTGLYHFALLLPRRVDLARWLAHAARDRVRLVGLSDHFVSEAIYLSDPDGHGIEIYWDRPRDVWEGQVASRMTTAPLDVDDLLGELADPRSERFDGLPAGTVMGHVHLKVATIPETVSFYRVALGFALMAQLGAQAAFLGAGGYHHHVGANTWESAGAAPPPAGTAALRQATIVLPDDAERDRVAARLEAHGHEPRDEAGGTAVRDPSGNPLLLAVAAG
jgi:catechol 2,3-dioxygenase